VQPEPANFAHSTTSSGGTSDSVTTEKRLQWRHRKNAVKLSGISVGYLTACRALACCLMVCLRRHRATNGKV